MADQNETPTAPATPPTVEQNHKPYVNDRVFQLQVNAALATLQRGVNELIAEQGLLSRRMLALETAPSGSFVTPQARPKGSRKGGK